MKASEVLLSYRDDLTSKANTLETIPKDNNSKQGGEKRGEMLHELEPLLRIQTI